MAQIGSVPTSGHLRIFAPKDLALTQEHHTAPLRLVNDIKIGTRLGVEAGALAVRRSPADEFYVSPKSANSDSTL